MAIVQSPPTGTTPHKTATSTGVADPKPITKPEFAEGMFLTVKTTAARVTFDGTTADPAAPNGLVLPVGGPYFFPFAAKISHTSDVAGTSELDVLYLS